jgi:hypothetical protein
MKKIIVTSTILLAVAATGFSQGLVNIGGGVSTATKMSTNSVVGGPSTGVTAAVGGTFYYALFASASNPTINNSSSGVSGVSSNYVFNASGWEFVGMATNQLSAGRFSAASQGAAGNPLNADGSMSVSGIAGAATAYLVTVGWENTTTIANGNTLAGLEAWYAAGANAGWIGQSAIATVTLGDGVSVSTPNPFGTTTGLVGGILLGETPAVPEPGAIAMAVLGGASLLAFRRKNK